MKRVYLAGGWFTPEQEEEHTRIYELIKDDFHVFNPRLAGEVKDSSDEDFLQEILDGNIRHIEAADIVVMIYDGKDTGTIWEAGYAFGVGTPIIYYAEKLNGKPFNIMLAKTGLFADNEAKLLELLNQDSSYNIKQSYVYKGSMI